MRFQEIPCGTVVVFTDKAKSFNNKAMKTI